MAYGFRRIMVIGFAVLYLPAYMIGTLAVFGQPTGPLSAVYPVPLDLPWILPVDVSPEVVRVSALPIVLAANPACLVMICRCGARRSRGGG